MSAGSGFVDSSIFARFRNEIVAKGDAADPGIIANEKERGTY